MFHLLNSLTQLRGPIFCYNYVLYCRRCVGPTAFEHASRISSDAGGAAAGAAGRGAGGWAASRAVLGRAASRVGAITTHATAGAARDRARAQATPRAKAGRGCFRAALATLLRIFTRCRRSTPRQAVHLQGLLPLLRLQARAPEPRTHAHWREALRVRRVPQALHARPPPQDAPPPAHWREAV